MIYYLTNFYLFRKLVRLFISVLNNYYVRQQNGRDAQIINFDNFFHLLVTVVLL